MGFSLRNSRMASVGLASVIAVGVIGVGSIALADEPDSGTPAPQGDRLHHPVAVGIGNLLEDSGVTREELKEGSAAGLTLAATIDQYGDVSAAEAKANALAALDARLDAAVAGGKVTQEKADEIAANAPAALDRLLATIPGANADGHHPRAKILAIAKHSLETVAGVLGIEVSDLRTELKDGKTVAEIAGPQTQAVIDALVSDANTAIDNAVAEGKLPADKADEAKARAQAAIEKWVNEGRPERPQGHMRKGLRPGAR